MTNDRRSTFRCARLAAAALALGIFTSAGIAGVNAQEASPEASPAAVACVSPGLPAGGEMSGAGMGTPEVVIRVEMASPEATVAATGTEADEATSAAVIAAIENYVACYNEGQATGDPGLYVALESQHYVESQGYATAEERAADEVDSPFATAQLLDADNVMTWDDGRVSVDAQLLIGPYWYNHWRIFFVEGDNGTWLYDDESDLTPQPDVDFVAVNGINLTDVTDETTGTTAPGIVAFSGSMDFTTSDALIFNITNSLTDTYSVAVVQVPDGADPAGILDGTVPFEDVTFVGASSAIEPDGAGDVTLVGLPVGAYAFLAYPDSGAAMPIVAAFNVVAAE